MTIQLPDNIDQAVERVKRILEHKVAEMPLDVFEILTGGPIEEYACFRVDHYPASKVFKEMYFVWLDDNRCVQLTPKLKAESRNEPF